MSDEIEEVDYEELGMDEDELTSDLFLHIDHEKKIVKATHSFEDKIAAAEVVIQHLLMMYGYLDEDLMEFIESLEENIGNLHSTLEKDNKQTIHFLLELEAAKKSGKKWVVTHAKKVKNEIKKVEQINQKFLKELHSQLSILKNQFKTAKHIFEVEIEKAQVKSLKIKLEEGEEEVLDILDKLLKFFIVYEHFFEQELKELK